MTKGKEDIQEDKCTHQLVNMEKLANIINEDYISKCCIGKDVDEFVFFCNKQDNQTTSQKLIELKE